MLSSSMLAALFALVNSLPSATAGFSPSSNGNVAIYWGEQLLPIDKARNSSGLEDRKS
jgi:hypothetical protein